jgi:hypothetical protein
MHSELLPKTDSYIGYYRTFVTMNVYDVVSTQFPRAVVAAVVIALLNLYTGEITALQPFLSDFILSVVALFIGFVVVDVVWNKTFNETET